MTGVLAEPLTLSDPLSIVAPPEVVAPRVNLLPRDIIERRALKRLAGILAGVVVGAAVLGGAVAYQAGSGKAAAQRSLDTENARNGQLQSQVDALGPVQKALTDAQAAQSSLRAALANEVLWSRFLDALRVQLPDGVRFSSVTIAPSTSSGTAAPAAVALPAPVGQSSTSAKTAPGAATSAAAVGTVTLNGVALSQDKVADLLASLATVDGFTNVYLSSTTAGATSGGEAPTVTFTVTADVTSAALSHRYDSTGG
jgi:Tfp pilus assembly protein PilN